VELCQFARHRLFPAMDDTTHADKHSHVRRLAMNLPFRLSPSSPGGK
jgi:hypothetical protein